MADNRRSEWEQFGKITPWDCERTNVVAMPKGGWVLWGGDAVQISRIKADDGTMEMEMALVETAHRVDQVGEG